MLNTTHIVAAAPMQDIDLYPVSSTIEILLDGRGWNQLPYQAEGSKLVTQSLGSNSGNYAIVYGKAFNEHGRSLEGPCYKAHSQHL